jgi:precorrin-6Y C5,15-methyltransferase (decarboxylating)
MLDAVARPGQETVDAIAPEQIAAAIAARPAAGRFAVLMSGDVGFFSGAKKLLPLLRERCDVRILPGLSSLVTLCARLGESYEDVVCVSLHGREHNLASDVRANRRVFTLVGGADGVKTLCADLCAAGLGGVRLGVGERLSYPDERVTRGPAETLLDEDFDALAVVLIENDAADAAVVSAGMPDEAFRRGGSEDGAVPMTKSEVRAVCLSKLRLTRGAVCWDVGAGTGSVSVEMARIADRGRVYAIERKEEASRCCAPTARASR